MNTNTLTNRYIADAQRASSLISWSKNGFIVYTPPTKTCEHNLLLTYLENVDKCWRLAKPQPIDVKLENSFLPEISLVSWSTLSLDLAVSDVYGNFYILMAGVGLLETKDSSPSYQLTSYNHMEMIYRDVINQDIKSPLNPGASIVAFKWLNIEKPQISNKPAALVTLESSYMYTYGVNQFSPYGVTHPIPTKQACLALRKNGLLMLYYQGEHKVEYHKASIQLVESDLVVIDKASMGFTNDGQVIVSAWDSLSDDIVTYSITIDWGFLVKSAKRQKSDPHYHTAKENQTAPTLTLREIHRMRPLQDLTSIDVISANAEKGSQMSILVSYGSTIYRHQLVEVAELISDGFLQLGNAAAKGAGAGAESSISSLKTVELVDTIQMQYPIRSIVSAASDLYTIIYSRKIDIVNNSTWSIIGDADFPPPTLSTMFDVGFDFPAIETDKPLIVAVSPNLTSLVYTTTYSNSLELTIKPLEKRSHLGFQPKELFATSAAFAYMHAFACYSNTCSDDLLLLIQSEIDRLRSLLSKQITEKVNVKLIVNKFILSLISESHKAINFQLDAFSKESVDKLLSNPPLQKLLSLQSVLGDANDNPVMSQIAWIVLNLRSVSFSVMFTLSTIYRQISKKTPAEDTMKDSSTRAEIIMSLIGNLAWFSDLLKLMSQQLVEITCFKRENLPVLPLILTKISRLFLLYAISSISKVHQLLKKLGGDLAESNKLYEPMKSALNRFFNITATMNLQPFEGFLKELDALIARENTKGNMKIDELKLILGEVAPELKTLVEQRWLLKDSKVDIFYNTDWVLDRRNKDSLRKVMIFGDKCRKCTRCAAVSLINDPLVFENFAIGLWTMVFQRTCICGNSWVNID
ncbi:uncharacterized protein LODBEIA_P60840 [Lodderomyces beijingensis]|uniref:Mediator of RNA polymerase II transcription subunit 16 n=1 Tax=Lodderomyces beijingensis TaxID=1775926 RepID=A0ABP0ZUP0_9ASCO